MASFAFKVSGIEPRHDPAWIAADDATRRAYWRQVVVVVMEIKDRDLAAGLDAQGDPMVAISEATRKKGRWRSHTGMGDPDAAPLSPAYRLSRTRDLFDGRAKLDHAEFFWRLDTVTGLHWGRVLGWHRAGKGRLPVRDVIGLSPRSRAEVKARMDSWWANHKHLKAAETLATSFKLIAPPVPAPAVPKPPATTTTPSPVSFKFATLGIGDEKLLQQAAAEGKLSAPKKLGEAPPKPKPPGGGTTPPKPPTPKPAPPPKPPGPTKGEIEARLKAEEEAKARASAAAEAKKKAEAEERARAAAEAAAREAAEEAARKLAQAEAKAKADAAKAKADAAKAKALAEAKAAEEAAEMAKAKAFAIAKAKAKAAPAKPAPAVQAIAPPPIAKGEPIPPKPTPKPPAWEPRPQSGFRAFTSGREMDEWGKAAYESWATDLPVLERNAIRVYAGDNYKWMNAILRGEVPEDMPGGMGMQNARRYVENAAAGLRRGRTPEAIVTHRGVQDSGAMGVPDPSKLVAGQELTIDSFGSATLSRQKAADFASAEGWGDRMAILQINQPKGSTGAYLNGGELSQYDDEREFLMPPGAKMRFIGMGTPHVLTGGREVPVAIFERVE